MLGGAACGSASHRSSVSLACCLPLGRPYLPTSWMAFPTSLQDMLAAAIVRSTGVPRAIWMLRCWQAVSGLDQGIVLGQGIDLGLSSCQRYPTQQTLRTDAGQTEALRAWARGGTMSTDERREIVASGCLPDPWRPLV